MIPETGRRFGPYEILGRLGSGGMGHVYRAWDARLHREVAVKFLHNEYSMPGMRERFLREARAASALNHPNICTIFDIGEQDGDPYLVMELLQGETLKDRIEKSSIHVDELLCLGKEVAEALGAAHAKGIVHRDVKPANIFLVQKPHSGFQSKVLDFGLAKIESGFLGARQSRSFDITTIGSTVGTLAYMSPEQARGEVLDSRSDLFSLGVVLYEMATRQIPFPGATSALVFVKLLNQQPEPVRDWNEAIPKDLDKIILKLLAKERTQRFQTSHELFEALSRVGEKSSGGWLRKAVSSTTSTVASSSRLAEPIIRERRSSKRRPTDPETSPARTSGPPSHASSPPQFLRPVARLPKLAGSRPSQQSISLPLSVVDEQQPLADAPSGIARILHDLTPIATENTASFTCSPAIAEAVSTPDILHGVPSGGELAANDVEPSKQNPFRLYPVWLIGGIVLLAVLAMTVVLVMNRGHFGPAMLTKRDAIVLTEIENRTGNKELDGSVAEALQIALAQSPYLLLRSGDDYRIMRRQVLTFLPNQPESANEQAARTIAQRLDTRAYLFGSIKGATPPYLIHVNLFSTATNEVMSSAEAHAPSLQEVPAAVDRLADDLRAAVGEDSASISGFHNALSREATSNIDALHLFALAEEAAVSLRILDAVQLYQQAVTLEPRFTLAYLRLAVLFRKQRAEIAAAENARLALATADNKSERERTLAEYEYEMNATGDYNRAAGLIRKIVTDNPNDAEALEKLANVLRLQGHMAESLQTAQQAYAIDPLNVDAYIQADSALIGLDRYDASFQMQDQLQRMGLARSGTNLTSAYLDGRQEAIDTAVATFQNHNASYKSDWNYGLYLDNIGHLADAEQLWRKNAAAARETKSMASAASFLLSQGALDHALIGDCVGGMAMAHEAADAAQGVTATFNSAMAAALCGESATAQADIAALQKNYPQSFNVNAFYIADIKAALALQANDPATALEELKPARQYDLISLTPFLRGRAHVALRQGQIGIVDYQTVLAHRGVTFIVGLDVYAIAEIGVARAFADTGDLNNSSDAYRKFLELWKTADPNQPLIREAKAHSR